MAAAAAAASAAAGTSLPPYMMPPNMERGFPQPPPAHMGIPPVHIETKAVSISTWMDLDLRKCLPPAHSLLQTFVLVHRVSPQPRASQPRKNFFLQLFWPYLKPIFTTTTAGAHDNLEKQFEIYASLSLIISMRERKVVDNSPLVKHATPGSGWIGRNSQLVRVFRGPI